ncbi:MAG: hypothetical protein ACREPL_06200 [Rhodanobacteraceae bacterium]
MSALRSASVLARNIISAEEPEGKVQKTTQVISATSENDHWRQAS